MKSRLKTLPNQVKLQIPAREVHHLPSATLKEKTLTVSCDKLFQESCKLALDSNRQKLKVYTETVVEKHLNAERPKRERRQPVKLNIC